MINLKLLNEIPRPEGWGECRFGADRYRCDRLDGTASVSFDAFGNIIYHSGWLQPVINATASFKAHGEYIRTGWLPIETAPRHGTLVDLLLDDGQQIPNVAHYTASGWLHHDIHGALHGFHGTPTHWRPLPPSTEAT